MNISNLQVGQEGYTQPWAIKGYKDKLFINSQFSARQTLGGTAEMKVRREKNGVVIDKAVYELYISGQRYVSSAGTISFSTQEVFVPDEDYFLVVGWGE